MKGAINIITRVLVTGRFEIDTSIIIDEWQEEFPSNLSITITFHNLMGFYKILQEH